MSLETGRILIVRSPLRTVRLSLRRWRRLTLDLRDARIDASPARCLRGPNRHRRLGYLRVIKRAAADEHEVGPRFCFAEHRRPARRTERAVHHTSAVCNAAIVAEFAFDRNCTLAKAGVHRPASRAQVLAETTPADASNDRSCADPIAHRLAQASTGDHHVDSSRLQTPPECHSAVGEFTAIRVARGKALANSVRAQALGVRPLRLHCTRHTWASLALASGKSVRWVAEQLGHADPALTLRVYAHAMREEESDLSFLEFGRDLGPGRPYTAPIPKSDSESEAATRASKRSAARIHGVSEGTRTPDLQGHNLAL